MRDFTMLRANLKRHKGALTGIGVLMFVAVAALVVVLTVWTHSRAYVYGEMRRLGYGDLTVWLSGDFNPASLLGETETLQEVASAGAQQIIYANYELRGQESDSEGQLITYSPDKYPYRFFFDNLRGHTNAPQAIKPGEIFVPASMVSMFGAGVGDRIEFVAARNGVTYPFVIKGFFEDPFMGSSMIGMKSFLICKADHDRLLQLSAGSGINALARGGAMMHVSQGAEGTLTAADLNSLLNKRTVLLKYTEFVHSRDALAGFMLLLQNIFSALLLAFVLILLITAFLVLGHTLGSSIEQDTVNLGILKTVGYTGGSLRRLQVLQYLVPVAVGSLAGIALAPVLSGFVSRMTLTSTGILIPSTLPIGLSLAAFLLIFALLFLFVMLRTVPVLRIPPATAVLRGAKAYTRRGRFPLRQAGLHFWMALRQLVSEKKQYVGAFLIALLLVFFASLVGRMNAWLGPDGEGLMDAFNPADLDLGVQIFSDLDRGEVEAVINSYSPIKDKYALAMPNVSLNGVDHAANVITQPDRLHILKGRPCAGADEVVLTEFLAADLGLTIGDRVTLSAQTGSAEYVVSGLYQCANDMGDNLGMSKEGFLRIAHDDPRIWCVHYFIEDSGKSRVIMEKLEKLYRADVHVHANSWPGLFGILGAMRMLMLFMYAVAAVVVLTAVWLSGSKLLDRERHDLGVYRVLGFSVGRLRRAFALRFFLVAAAGALVGLVLSAVLTDPLVDPVMRFAGISGFASHPGPGAVMLPAVVVVALFAGFAYVVSRKIGHADMNTLIRE